MKQVIPPWTLALALGVLLSAWAAPGAAADLPRSSGGRILSLQVGDLYARAASAVVGITCREGRRNVYFGTGAVIDPSGLVLTSLTVVPERARDIRVYFQGGRTGSAEVVLVSPERETCLLRITSVRKLIRAGERLPYLELGDSSDVRTGDPAFTLGNAFHSIEQDDQVCFAAGVVSGRFDIKEKHVESKYLGPTLETSAALNNGMDGGPLLNRHGEIIGLLSLSFSRQRWLGTAIPINEIKPALARHRGWFNDRYSKCRVYAGIEVFDLPGSRPQRVRVGRVRPGEPAADAGFRRGDVLTVFGDKPVESVSAFRDLFKSAPAGKEIAVTVERDGKALTLKLVLWRRF